MVQIDRVQIDRVKIDGVQIDRVYTDSFERPLKGPSLPF